MTGERRERTFAPLPPGIVRVRLQGQSAGHLAELLAAIQGVTVLTGPDAYPGDRLYLTVSVLTFMDEVAAGRATLNQVDDWIDTWHDTTGLVTLADHLGLTQDEYKRFVADPPELAAIVDERRREAPRG